MSELLSQFCDECITKRGYKRGSAIGLLPCEFWGCMRLVYVVIRPSAQQTLAADGLDAAPKSDDQAATHGGR